MKKLIFITIILVTMLLTGCESCSRNMKSIKSDFRGGLKREVTVYSFDGKLIKTYKGCFDIQISEGGKVLFDLDNKRYIIYNAIVISEEK